MSSENSWWKIIDDNGVIESGSEEEIKDIWLEMLNGNYNFNLDPPRKGDLRLIQVHGTI